MRNVKPSLLTAHPPPLPMSIAALEAKRAAAIAALESGDYAGAIRAAMAAKLILATLPNTSRSSGAGAQSLAWNAAAIDAFIAQCRELSTSAEVAAGGIRQTKITLRRPGTTELCT